MRDVTWFPWYEYCEMSCYASVNFCEKVAGITTHWCRIVVSSCVGAVCAYFKILSHSVAFWPTSLFERKSSTFYSLMTYYLCLFPLSDLFMHLHDMMRNVNGYTSNVKTNFWLMFKHFYFFNKFAQDTPPTNKFWYSIHNTNFYALISI